MPNWVTVHLNVESKDPNKLKEFMAFVEEPDEDENVNLFSFNKLIPMPESVSNVIAGSYSTVGYEAWHGDPSKVLGYPWVAKENIKNAAELQDFLQKRSKDYKIQADLAKKAIDETGYMDWYQWSIDKWGTKWNAQSVEKSITSDNSVSYFFMTAWSFPEPVIRELARQFPDLTFDGNFFEEAASFEGDFEYAPGSELVINYKDGLADWDQGEPDFGENDNQWF
jgi:hypothetical protein